MAMSEATLTTRMIAAIGLAPTPEGQAIQQQALSALAKAVVEEIQQNGVVTVAAGIPVTTGASTGATTGTGTGTIA